MRFLLSVFISFFLVLIHANDFPLEDVFDFVDSEAEENEYSDIVSQLSQKPINLTTATKSDLEILFWLSEEQQQILFQLSKSGTLSYQKLTAFGFSDKEIGILRKYTVIRQPISFHQAQRIRLTYQEKYKNEPSSSAFYQRILGSLQDFEYGFLNQKDATEKEFTNFYSYFVTYQSESLLQKLVLGRYRLAFGQGLLLTSKLGLSKGSATTTLPAKHQLSLRGYTSSYEIWFMEGGAAQISKDNVSLIPFYSKAKYAASLQGGKISSFNESGIYSPTQTYTQNTLTGSYLRWQAQQLAFGATFLSNQFEHPFLDDKKAQSYLAFAADWHYSSDSFRFGGEIANADEKTAYLSYFRWGDRKIKHLILVRNYPSYFPTWHGNPFSSQSSFDNEQGIYYGLQTRIGIFKLNAFFDVWRCPDTRYYEKMPTVASEEYLQLETKSKRQKWTFSVNHKNKEKYKTLEDESKIRNFQRTVLRNDWWHYFDWISLKTRFEYASEYYQEEQLFHKGMLISQLAKIHFSNLQCIAQIAMYHSDVLHYLYEYSMEGQMENAVLKGDGFYSYLLVKYTFKDNLKVQWKISDRWNEKEYLKIGMQIEYLL